MTLTPRQYRYFKLFSGLLISFCLIFAEQLLARGTNYYPVLIPASPEPKVVTEEPEVAAPSLVTSTNPCSFSRSFGMRSPGFDMTDSEVFVDTDCETRAQMRAAHFAKARAADYMPFYREQKEKQFFREEMEKIGYVRGDDGVWYKKSVVMEMVERYFGPKVREEDVWALGIVAGVLLLILGGMLTLMAANRASRDDRPAVQRKHMS